LDVGCGENKRGNLGVDIRRTNAVDVLASADCLPFRDESFDQVNSVTLLEHCVNPFNVLVEQVRVLRKGGKIICETDNARYWRYHVWLMDHVRHWKSIDGEYGASETHYMIFYPENVEKMFSLLGLRRIVWRYRKPSLKVDRLLKLLPFARENSCSRFVVEASK